MSRIVMLVMFTLVQFSFAAGGVPEPKEVPKERIGKPVPGGKFRPLNEKEFKKAQEEEALKRRQEEEQSGGRASGVNRGAPQEAQPEARTRSSHDVVETMKMMERGQAEGRFRVSAEGKITNETELKAATEKKLKGNALKQMLEYQEERLKDIGNEESAKRGFFALNEMILGEMRNGKLDAKGTVKLLRKIFARLGGAGEKEVDTAVAALCAGECGSKTTEYGCRVMGAAKTAWAGLAAAAKSPLGQAACAAFITNFISGLSNAQANQTHIDVSTGLDEPKSVNVNIAAEYKGEKVTQETPRDAAGK